MTPRLPEALTNSAPKVFWLDDPQRPDPLPALLGSTRADLAVVGGGYTGLWAALLAKERDPGAVVVVLEAGECGWAASGRNGGFCAASVTHGFANGQARWPQEMPSLLRLGRENLAAIEAAVAAYDIDCGFERTGELVVATQQHQVAGLLDNAAQMRAAGIAVQSLDRSAVRAQLDSPTYLAGSWDPDGVALLNPARLVWGLRAACLEAGVRIHEQTRVRGLQREPDGGVTVLAPAGEVHTRQVMLATNAFPPPLRRLRLFTVPVYDYALVSEPLSAQQRAALGWTERQGVSDSGNQFHYYRLTADDRVLWGGYDAIYHYGSSISPRWDDRPATYAALAANFQATFPQLDDLRFTHRWGGVIDTCTRFCPFYGTAVGGRVAYALGFTGLGVGSSRFAAQVMLGMLEGKPTERTELAMVREKPAPFPPEPLRYAGIELTRRSLARSDARAGRRNLWLRSLDKVGWGFDS